jgi:hypothetical protein
MFGNGCHAGPALRRKPGGRRFRLLGKRYARCHPRASGPPPPDKSSRSIPSSSTSRPARPSSTSPLRPGRQNGRWQASPGATANLAARFLDKVLSQMPFKLSGIQVDGGSEFMADFEQGMQANKLDLFVAAAKVAAGQRCRRTLQRRMAIRVLCRPRLAAPDRQNQSCTRRAATQRARNEIDIDAVDLVIGSGLITLCSSSADRYPTE